MRVSRSSSRSYYLALVIDVSWLPQFIPMTASILSCDVVALHYKLIAVSFIHCYLSCPHYLKTSSHLMTKGNSKTQTPCLCLSYHPINHPINYCLEISRVCIPTYFQAAVVCPQVCIPTYFQVAVICPPDLGS